MVFSRPTLHPRVITSAEHRERARTALASLASARPPAVVRHPVGRGPIPIPLSTVSLSTNFDAFINVQFPNPDGQPAKAELLVDSGHATMIVPYAEHLKGLPGYTVLGKVDREPWGAPAVVMKGPLQIATADNRIYEIDDCVFHACTGNNDDGERTAIFGTGCLSPWSASTWNTQLPGVTLQSPLSYNAAYPYAEIVHAPEATTPADADDVQVSDASMLVLHASEPPGFTMLDIIKGVEFMSVVPAGLRIGGSKTGWPGDISSPIAMIDTGGGPVLVSDPKGYVHARTWLNEVDCPLWTQNKSRYCNCVSDRLEIDLKSAVGKTSYVYTIDTSAMPKSVQGLTAVMCMENEFMSDRQGMNVGGITALFNRVLIDYAGARVGLAPKYPTPIKTVEMGASVHERVSTPPTGLLLGYHFYPPGRVLTTTLTISHSGFPRGTTLLIAHGGSAGAEVVSWSGLDRVALGGSGSITVTFGIKRTTGPAVPIFISAIKDDLLPLNLRLDATTT